MAIKLLSPTVLGFVDFVSDLYYVFVKGVFYAPIFKNLCLAAIFLSPLVSLIGWMNFLKNERDYETNSLVQTLNDKFVQKKHQKDFVGTQIIKA